MNAAPPRKAIHGKKMRPGNDIRKLGVSRKILVSDFCPVRTFENCPAIYRWVNDERMSKPRRGERNLKTELFLPSLTGLINLAFYPTDKSVGYCLSPSGLEWRCLARSRCCRLPIKTKAFVSLGVCDWSFGHSRNPG